jgi:quercetin dioxygenase-like cupin family protein
MPAGPRSRQRNFQLGPVAPSASEPQLEAATHPVPKTLGPKGRFLQGEIHMSDVKVVRASKLPFFAVEGDGAKGLELARLYQHPQSATTFQLARVAPGGVSKRHAHEWDQANWIASGEAEVDVDGELFRLGAGDSIVIPGGKAHSFSNPGDTPLTLVAVLGPRTP